MPSSSNFWVKFWGVRGSIATPGETTLKYGGNTSCLEVRCGGYRLIFDAGTGLKCLGDSLMDVDGLNCDILLTHTHVDHINGFPFFTPAYRAGNRIKMWAGHLKPAGRTLEGVLRTMMDQPFFPVTVDVMAAERITNDFTYGETLHLSPEITLRTAPLNHPDGATGYRVEFEGRSLCYVTDTEHTPGILDARILGLIENADMLIYDSTYTDDEYPRYKGWGHSTWQEGVRLCNAANVKSFVAFHHDPSHDDAFMDRIAAQLEQTRPGSTVAREGTTLRL